MSIEAMVWALNDADVMDAGELVVLLGLANHADRDGRNAWPAQKTLARYARCSIRTVRRKLSDLEARGVILRGNQTLVQTFPADARPVVWDVSMVVSDRPDTVTGRPTVTGRDRTRGAEGPANGVQGDGPTLADESSYEPSSNRPMEPSSGIRPRNIDAGDEFRAWYAAYPRKAGKAAAAKAYAAARKTVPADVLLEGASRYAADPNRADAFTKYPATWLNAGCWDDEPLPGPALDRGAGILAGELSEARAADLARATAGARLALGGLR